MEGFLHAVYSVTIILLLTATGYFCAARGWMGPQAKAFIGKFTDLFQNYFGITAFFSASDIRHNAV